MAQAETLKERLRELRDDISAAQDSLAEGVLDDVEMHLKGCENSAARIAVLLGYEPGPHLEIREAV